MLYTLFKRIQIENFYWNIGFYALIALCIGHFLFIFLFLYLDVLPLVLLNILSVVSYLYCIFGLFIKTLESKDDTLIGWIVYIELIIHAVVVTRYIGAESGFQYYMYTLGLLPFFTFSYPKYIQILRTLFSIFIAILIEVSGYFIEPFVKLESDLLFYLHTINLFIFLFSMSIISYFYTQNTQQYQKRLLNQNIMDPLTNLYNRRYIIQLGEKNVLEYQMNGTKFSLLLIDVDYFKKVNDSYGHMCGDEILVNISTLFKENVRPSSIVSRWGGEEFLILFPNIDSDKLHEIAERLRLLVEKNTLACADKKITITITLGGAVSHNDESFYDLLNRADIALYEGKENGRNQVCIK